MVFIHLISRNEKYKYSIKRFNKQNSLPLIKKICNWSNISTSLDDKLAKQKKFKN